MSTLRAGLYVHLPWCERKCPYCDFNSFEAHGAIEEQRYVDALLVDLGQERRRWGGLELESVFIGGGTPSLFSGAALARLLDGIAATAALAGDCEVTLEANPGSAEAARFAAYRAAGVNRLSLGVQSFDDASLAALGRVHDAAAARAAIGAARAAGFDNLNLDLMFGLPGAAPGAAVAELEQAIAYGPEHLSWYQLTLEQGTAFAARPPALPSHDAVAADFEAGLERLAAAGFEHYEISAHARAGKAARHNLNYWRFGDYLGIGAGAHGKVTTPAGGTVRREKIRNPGRYMASLLGGGDAATEAAVAAADIVTEYMLNALRLSRGFTLADLGARTGLPPAAVRRGLGAGLERGWLERDAALVRPTARGFRFLTDLQLLFVGDEAGAPPIQH
ncbi:MAG: radical SAM family heme chaperone HemW [Gammaproteobacteria bacterium]